MDKFTKKMKIEVLLAATSKLVTEQKKLEDRLESAEFGLDVLGSLVTGLAKNRGLSMEEFMGLVQTSVDATHKIRLEGINKEDIEKMDSEDAKRAVEEILEKMTGGSDDS